MVFLDEVKNASGALFCEYDRPFWLVYSKNKHVWCKFLNKVANYEVFKKKNLFLCSFCQFNLVVCYRDNTKTTLLDSMYVFLKRPEYIKYVSNLVTVCSRILLTQPPG